MVKNLPQYRRSGFDPWVRKVTWRRNWQPTPEFLPGKSPGQKSLVGYSPWGCKDSDTTEATNTSLLTNNLFSLLHTLLAYEYIKIYCNFTPIGILFIYNFLLLQIILLYILEQFP